MTRSTSIFKHGVQNIMIVYGVIMEIAILMVICYIPAVQTVFETANLGGIQWTWWLASGVCLFLLNEIRKWWTRKHPDGKIAELLAW